MSTFHQHWITVKRISPMDCPEVVSRPLVVPRHVRESLLASKKEKNAKKWLSFTWFPKKLTPPGLRGDKTLLVRSPCLYKGPRMRTTPYPRRKKRRRTPRMRIAPRVSDYCKNAIDSDWSN